MTPTVDYIIPYCKGCGHNFFPKEPRLPHQNEVSRPSPNLCKYCVEEERAGAENREPNFSHITIHD